MPFERTVRQHLFRQVAEQIEQAILTGTYPEGGRLPSEQNLADQFSVSRNVVREALKSLEERGLVDIRTGSGAYVTSPSSDLVSDAISRFILSADAEIGVEDLYQIRRLLEGAAVRIAAVRATDEDFAALDKTLERMKSLQDVRDKYVQADLDFHRHLAAATHNPLFSLLLQPIVGLLIKAIAEGYDVGASPQGIAAHEMIISLLRARDPEGVYGAMMSHLVVSEQRMKQAQNHDGTVSSVREIIAKTRS